MPRAPSSSSLYTRIARKVAQAEPGSVFTAKDFSDIGRDRAVAKSLERLVRVGKLRRITRGIYDKPRQDPLLGTLWPDPDDVIKAITVKEKLRLQPAGVHAANMLGLSEQVPAKYVFLTDGRSRMLKAGPFRFQLKHTTPRNMAAAGRFTGLLIQAFKSLGPKHIDRLHLEFLKKKIPAAELKALQNDLDLAPACMRPLFLDLAGSPPSPRMKPLRDKTED
jgi:hypothetical protein